MSGLVAVNQAAMVTVEWFGYRELGAMVDWAKFFGYRQFEPMVTVHCFVADAQDALHVQAKYAVDEKKREIFFFR